ncbi:MAG: flavodoxin-dependent (E)-4-hydroxy-3-methylbut-2-enyl-diphosphate synthase [Deltaproteobacteria bacterium]|nr:flavodoxin-dependent (E)-4-hydroxy-3-methylbut-2-enyl-diphosphate synthase [Deltaproteobacteria bacterium]
MKQRRKPREISIGAVRVGGDSPISIQSMTNTATEDIHATVSQIKALEAAGCEIVRVAVPNMDAADKLGEIRRAISIPLIADIHFDYLLALKAIDEGVDGLRLNPGNIGSRERVREVVSAAAERKIPIRIGVNAGSLEKDIYVKYGHPTPQARVESAMRHNQILEDMGFYDIKVSLKASSVGITVDAYRLLAEKTGYPFHVGITEAGTIFSGTIKSAVGLGALLYDGLGDTLRVSLTANPVEEVRVGWEILKSLGLRARGVTIISCPTCGRIRIDAEALATEIEKRLAHVKEPLNVAVMGCVVNGPGEAIEADVGIAGGDGVGLIYVKGEPLKKVKEHEIVDAVVFEVENLVREKEKVFKSDVTPS